jgi:hypothetical protein
MAETFLFGKKLGRYALSFEGKRFQSERKNWKCGKTFVNPIDSERERSVE